MAKPKTVPTEASVDAFLGSRVSPAQLADCHALMAMLKRVTRQEPRMWGPSIVGYGRYAYRYESGRTGEMCLTGFSVRGKDLVLYLLADGPEQAALLARLGKHKTGQSCLYIKRLSDINRDVLTELITASVTWMRNKYPT